MNDPIQVVKDLTYEEIASAKEVVRKFAMRSFYLSKIITDEYKKEVAKRHRQDAETYSVPFGQMDLELMYRESISFIKDNEECSTCDGEGEIHDADFSDGDSDQQMLLKQDTLRPCPDCSRENPK